MIKFLCIIVDADKKELASYDIELERTQPNESDDSWYYHRIARLRALDKFELDFPEFKDDDTWKVDSCLA
jgi:hypothetical protein